MERGRRGKEEAKRGGRWRRSERGEREEEEWEGKRNGREEGRSRPGGNEAWRIERWVRREWTDARW